MAWDNLSDAIFDRAARRPDARALIEGPATLSYRDVAALVAKATTSGATPVSRRTRLYEPPGGKLVLTASIRYGATEVFAPEVEAALALHPAVAKAAVVGILAPARGEEVVAFVVKRGALEHDELSRHCRATLTPPQRPERVYYVDALPRIAGGKVDRAKLQSLALSRKRCGAADKKPVATEM